MECPVCYQENTGYKLNCGHSFVINAFLIGTKNTNRVHAQFAAKIYFLIRGKFTYIVNVTHQLMIIYIFTNY